VNRAPDFSQPLPPDGLIEFTIEFEVGAVLHSVIIYSTAMRLEVYVDGRSPAELNGSAVPVRSLPCPPTDADPLCIGTRLSGIMSARSTPRPWMCLPQEKMVLSR